MKKTKREKTPAALPIPKKKKPVAGRTAQKTRKAAPVKEGKNPIGGAKARGEGLPEDPPPVAGEYPPILLPIRNMTPAQEPKGDGMGFTWNFIPLDASQRRARKGLLRQWVATKDPFVAEALRRQEGIEIPYREALAGVFGKKGGWRESMIIQARHDKECREELGEVLSGFAVTGQSEELDAFSKATEWVERIEECGPINRKFVCGLMFVLRCQIETGCLPPQNKVREFLKENGMPVDDRKNEARDLFKGPIMGTLPKGKAGAPRGPRG
jgi:hypothetical protein